MGLPLSPNYNETPLTIQPPLPEWYPIFWSIPEQVFDELRATISANDWDAFDRLIKLVLSGPDKRIHIDNLHRLMLEAIKRNDAEAVAKLLSYGMHMHWTAAQDAVEARAKECLEVFLQYGWDINEPVSETEPPVLGFVIEDREMTPWLLDHGADLNKQPRYLDLTPMSWAVESVPPAYVEELLDRGADVQKGELLQHALDRPADSSGGTVEVLRMLIDRGAPLNALMYEHHDGGWMLYSMFMPLGTPLHKAAEMGKTDEVRYLLQRGADGTIKDLKGRTAMECAEREGFTEIVDILKAASGGEVV